MAEVYLTDHKRTFTFTPEQVRNLLGWMKVCAAIMNGTVYPDVPYTPEEAKVASLATRKALEADGCHINYEDGEFIAFRGHVSYR